MKFKKKTPSGGMVGPQKDMIKVNERRKVQKKSRNTLPLICIELWSELETDSFNEFKSKLDII